MLAATEERDEAGSDQYTEDHFGKILQQGFSFSGFERDHLWVNHGGERYVDISGVSGLDSDTDGRGAAYADFDNDGDLDIFLTAFQGMSHHLFKNQVGQDGGWIRVTLEGVQSGRDANGAIVRTKTSQGVLTKVKSAGSGFVSQGDPRLLFGLGSDESAEWVEVRWPSGTVDRFENVSARTSLLATEGESRTSVAETAFELPGPDTGREDFLRHLAIKPGDAFPDLPVTDAGGEVTSVAAARRPGRHTLVNLWATYCVPCRREMPELTGLSSRYSAAGCDVLGVSVDMKASPQQIARTLKKLKVTYPSVTATEALFPALFSGEQFFIPMTYLLDPQGIVVEVFKGWSPAARERIESLIGVVSGS